MRGEEDLLGGIHHSRADRGCRAPPLVGAGGHYSVRLCRVVGRVSERLVLLKVADPRAQTARRTLNR